MQRFVNTLQRSLLALLESSPAYDLNILQKAPRYWTNCY